MARVRRADRGGGHADDGGRDGGEGNAFAQLRHAGGGAKGHVSASQRDGRDSVKDFVHLSHGSRRFAWCVERRTVATLSRHNLRTIGLYPGRELGYQARWRRHAPAVFTAETRTRRGARSSGTPTPLERKKREI